MPREYDVLVIGGGAAGLSAAGISANLGAKTLLVEEARLGGDCTWTGCVPSKTLLYASKIARMTRTGVDYGISADRVEIDFRKVMERVRRAREHIYESGDTPDAYARMGVTVRKAACRFVDEHTVELDDGSMTTRAGARYIIIAAGASPRIPSIDGLDTAGYHTNESIFEIDERPRNLLILGGGQVGIELAQAFQRLGSDVAVVDMADRILPGDDAEPAAMLRGILEEEGVRFHLGADIRAVRRVGPTVELEVSGRRGITGDALLVAAGRRPNTQGLGLDLAGVTHDERGIRVDDRCRTSVSHIYAVGDIADRFAFAHTAEHMARTAVANALLKIPRKLESVNVPWVTFTDPELAHVGATEHELNRRAQSFETHRFPYDRLDRAVIEGRPEGAVIIYARPWDGKILGAAILGARAGEMISEIALAMQNGIPLRKISDTIHPYPTYSLGVRRAADQWYVRRRMAGVIKAMQGVFGYRGSVRSYGRDEVV